VSISLIPWRLHLQTTITPSLCGCAQLRGVVHAADGVGVLTAISSAANKNGSVAELAAATDLTAAERVQLRAFLLQV